MIESGAVDGLISVGYEELLDVLGVALVKGGIAVEILLKMSHRQSFVAG